MKKFGKGIAVALASVMAVSMAACSTNSGSDFNPDATAATYGNKAITMREANFMLRYEEWMEEASSAYMNSYYQYYGYENMWAVPSGVGSKTIGDYFKEVVMAQIHQTNVLNDHAQELGIELTDLQKTAVSDAVADLRDASVFNQEFWNYTDATDEQITEWLTANAIAVLVNNKIKEDAEVTVTDDEVKSFTINYVTVGADATNETEAPSTEDTEAETDPVVEEAADGADEAASGEAEDGVEEAVSGEVADGTDEAASGEAADGADEAVSGETADGAAAVDGAADAQAETESAEAETQPQEIFKGEALADKVLELVNAGSTTSEAASAMNNLYSQSASYRFAEDDEAVTGTVLFSEGSKLAEGQAVKVTNPDGGWYVIYCVSDDDALAAEDARTTLTEEKKEEVFNTKYAEWEAAAPAFKVMDVWNTIEFGDLIYVAPTSAASEETDSAVADDLAGLIDDVEVVTESASEDVDADAAGAESAAESEAADGSDVGAEESDLVEEDGGEVEEAVSEDNAGEDGASEEEAETVG